MRGRTFPLSIYVSILAVTEPHGGRLGCDLVFVHFSTRCSTSRLAYQQTFRFSLYWERLGGPSFRLGSDLPRFRLFSTRKRKYTSRRSFLRYLGTSVPPGFGRPLDAFDCSSERALRAAQVGCGVSEDGPDKILHLKPGLGPDEQLTT